MRPIRNALTDRKNMIGSRAHRLPGFEKEGAPSVVSVNPGSCDGGATVTVDISVPGAKPVRWHLVVVVPPVDLEAGLAALSSEIVGADTVRLLIANRSAAPINGASRNWEVFLFRRRAT
jgi:hypothetical protein